MADTESELLLPVIPSSEDSCHRRLMPKLSVEAVMFLYFLYFSGASPLVSQFVHHQFELQYGTVQMPVPCNTSNTSNEVAGHVEAASSLWLMYMNIASTVPSFFSTILIGGYSDYAGRKVAMVLPLIGASLRLLLFIFVFAYQLDLLLLILASFLDGVGGGTSTMLMACFAYISDVTDNKGRSVRVVFLDVCCGFAVVTSTLATGFALVYIGFLWTFVVLLGVIAAALIYVVFLLPESVGNNGVDDVRFFNVQHFIRLWRLLSISNEITGQHWIMRFSVCLVLLICGIQLGRFDVETLTMLSPPLCFNSVWIGYFYATAYFTMNFAMAIMTHFMARCFDDLVLVVIGLISGMGYAIMFGLATNKLVLFMSTRCNVVYVMLFGHYTEPFVGIFFVAPVVGCLSLLPIPLLRSYSSKTVQPSEMGTMFAGIAWFQALGILIGNSIQNAVLASTAHFTERFVFFLDSGAYLFTVLLVMYFMMVSHRRGWTSKRVIAINEGD